MRNEAKPFSRQPGSVLLTGRKAEKWVGRTSGFFYLLGDAGLLHVYVKMANSFHVDCAPLFGVRRMSASQIKEKFDELSECIERRGLVKQAAKLINAARKRGVKRLVVKA